MCAVMAYVMLNEETFKRGESSKVHDKVAFSQIEKQQLIQDSLKIILNSVIYDPLEPIIPIDIAMNR